jgi:hypothetical protein
MSSSNDGNFIAALVGSELLTRPQLAELERNLRPQFVEPIVLARELVRRGWITSLQANRVLTGRVSSLRFGPYLLLDKVGQGCLGKVYKARNVRTNQVFAVKLFHPELVQRADAVRRLHRTADALRDLKHPNLLRLLESGQSGPNHYLVLEYVSGGDLWRVIRQRGRQTVLKSCEFARAAAQGLAAVHARGGVHGDVKPAHLLVDARSGGLKLADTGWAHWAANLTDPAARTVLLLDPEQSTPDFQAPEAAADPTKPDPRSDVYSLGCTLYALLTGKPPYPAGGLAEKRAAHGAAQYIPPEHLRKDMPGSLVTLLRRMMSVRPEQRPDMAEVAEELGAQTGDSSGAVDFSMEGLVPVQASGVTMAGRAGVAADMATVKPVMAGAPPAAPAGDETGFSPTQTLLLMVAAAVIGGVSVGLVQKLQEPAAPPPAAPPAASAPAPDNVPAPDNPGEVRNE